MVEPMIQSAGPDTLAAIHAAIEWAALGIELLAVAMVVTAVLLVAVTPGTVRYLFHTHTSDEYQRYRQRLGRPLLPPSWFSRYWCSCGRS